jgi:post-segregation antitoxin (ccd killing protein)
VKRANFTVDPEVAARIAELDSNASRIVNAALHAALRAIDTGEPQTLRISVATVTVHRLEVEAADG